MQHAIGDHRRSSWFSRPTAELAALLVRNVTYEVPALRKQIARCQQAQQDLARREEECQLAAAELRERFYASCKQYGITVSPLVLLWDPVPFCMGRVTPRPPDRLCKQSGRNSAVCLPAPMCPCSIRRGAMCARSCWPWCRTCPHCSLRLEQELVRFLRPSSCTRPAWSLFARGGCGGTAVPGGLSAAPQ